MSVMAEMECQQEITIKTTKAPTDQDDASVKPGKKTCRILGALSRHMEKFINQPELSDVIIQFAGKQYRAHKLMLCAWSKVFDEKISNMETRSEGNCIVLNIDEEVELDGAEGDICESFHQFVTFLYSGKTATALTDSNVKFVLTLAQTYQIQPLQEQCEEHIAKEVGKHNLEKALEWLVEAERSHLTVLKQNCLTVIKAYFQFIPPISWQALRLDQVIAIISASDVVVEDEFTLFLQIETWIQAHQDVSDDKIIEYLENILPHIRFPHMTVWQLQRVSKSRLGHLITQKHPEYVMDAINTRALASEEQDFSEISDQPFPPPRLYLKFVCPGDKPSSQKDRNKDVFTRARCNIPMSYSDRRATVFKRKVGGLYQLVSHDTWEVRLCTRQDARTKCWCVQVILLPKIADVGKHADVVLCIKVKQDFMDPLVVVYSGVVQRVSERGVADGIVMMTDFILKERPEYVHMREVVYMSA